MNEHVDRTCLAVGTPQQSVVVVVVGAWYVLEMLGAIVIGTLGDKDGNGNKREPKSASLQRKLNAKQKDFVLSLRRSRSATKGFCPGDLIFSDRIKEVNDSRLGLMESELYLNSLYTQQ